MVLQAGKLIGAGAATVGLAGSELVLLLYSEHIS